MRLAEDRTSWKASSVERRDFRHVANGPEVQRKRGSRKSTKRWCKGVVSREHVEIVDRQSMTLFREKDCGVSDRGWRSGQWICYHVIKCANCGKILREWLGDDCPDKSP